MNRRTFHKLFGYLGLSSLFLKSQMAFADDPCVQLSASESPQNWDQHKILSWLDVIPASETNEDFRANLAILIKHQQIASSYIDKVVLTDSQEIKIIAARYYSEDDKITSDFLPYFLVSNIIIKKSTPYYLFLQLRENNQIKPFRYTFSDANLESSTLTGIQLGVDLSYKMSKSKHQGVCQTPHIQTLNSAQLDSYKQHNFKAYINDIRNEDFTVFVGFMHNDIDASHYMRHCIVTDPVGRILGFAKREFGDSTKNYSIVNQLSEVERGLLGITLDQVPKIKDCPYIMVFCDDIEVLSKVTIYLR